MAEQQSNGSKASESGGHGSTAMKAAVAAAATGVAAIAVTKALSGSQSGSKAQSSKSSENGNSGSGSFMSAIASGSWGAAQDALVPLAEEAAGAAGTYLGKNGPEIVKETIVPKFIESFNAASGE